VALKHAAVLMGCAAAVTFGSVLTASPAVAKECPWGTSPTRFEGVCSPGGSGGTAGNGNAVVPPPSTGGAVIVNNPNQLPTVNGIPCTVENWNKCQGMINSQG
jgi:hypothetical protein